MAEKMVLGLEDSGPQKAIMAILNAADRHANALAGDSWAIRQDALSDLHTEVKAIIDELVHYESAMVTCLLRQVAESAMLMAGPPIIIAKEPNEAT